MARYPNISDHGLIGDLQTAALVTNDGNVDWFCCPRFDSPSIFASLLDAQGGGHFRIAPDRDDYVSKQLYLPDSAVLVTRFMTPDGVGEVIDFMPVITGKATGRHRLARMLKVPRGTMRFAMDLQPRFDYARQSHTTELSENGAVFRSEDAELTLHTVGRRGQGLDDAAPRLQRDGDGIRATWTLREGQVGGVVLESAGGPPRRMQPWDLERLADDTASFWRSWLHHSTYTGRWREMVARSAMTLKLMTYAPTGAPVAAPTTGLPEQVGGERNWDYRYCWLRDATLTLSALMAAGYRDEAAAWRDWLLRAAAGDPSKLQIMYGVAGEKNLKEDVLDWLPGYEGSRPVRIGNAASAQYQLDVYGEVLGALHEARRTGLEPAGPAWDLELALMDFIETGWARPDDGIWEVRGPRRHFTHSKVEAWVAVDRAIHDVEDFGLEGPLDRWKSLRARIHKEVCEKGFDTGRNTFTQYYGSKELDASVLMIPIVGFLPPKDSRVIGTVEAIERELTVDGFVSRYDSEKSEHVDGLTGREGAFLACSFWLVDDLHLIGRHDDAMELFERLLSLRTDLGLLAEEYDPVAGRLVGNFPQAFSHVSLVNTTVGLLNMAQGFTHEHRLAGIEPAVTRGLQQRPRRRRPAMGS